MDRPLTGIQPTTYVTATTFRLGAAYDDLTAEGYGESAVPEPGTIVLIGRRLRAKAQKV